MDIFHVHTYRCGHASMEQDEDYILAAEKLGAKSITFTDHAPFPGNPFTGRMLFEQLPEYISTLKALKEVYQDRIKVNIGLEIEYLPFFNSYYKELDEEEDIDCLLLGQHFCELPNVEWSFRFNNIGLMESQIQAVKTGYFDAIAHPDRYMLPEEAVLVKDLVKECKCYDVALEHNLSVDEKDEFWRCLDDDSKTFIGYDAHSIKDMQARYVRLYGEK